MSAEVLHNQANRVWLHWQVNGRGKWRHFGVECPVSELPATALNVLRKRTEPNDSVVFGFTLDGHGQTVVPLGKADLERLIASQNDAGLTEDGRTLLGCRILDP
ncbi:MAG: hypothetical protein AAB880_00695 [Patescibacteria group bacterium]